MKLVELLARELKEWPVVDGVEPNYIVQEGDKELYSTTIRPIYRGSETWHRSPNDNTEYCGYFDVTTEDLAEDWTAAIVTPTDWAAERARIAKPAKKADKDGWIRHRGGKCPVDKGVRVDVRYRSGMVNEHVKALESVHPDGSVGLTAVTWEHYGSIHDIMAYKLHKPAEHQDPDSYFSEQESMAYVDAYHSFVGEPGGPFQWRDRIAEIDATTQALTTERAELVQKLASEGFALIGRAVEPVEDMSDWRNWKVGDFIEATDTSGGYSPGCVYEIRGFDINRAVVLTVSDDYGSKANGWSHKFFKFHSRPSA